ncbi:MAG: hypothetical protein JXB07_00615 [Anaerolineae bacterium]|nr:hypothetical protein [Anaerolineae bacterium]
MLATNITSTQSVAVIPAKVGTQRRGTRHPTSYLRLPLVYSHLKTGVQREVMSRATGAGVLLSSWVDDVDPSRKLSVSHPQGGCEQGMCCFYRSQSATNLLPYCCYTAAILLPYSYDTPAILLLWSRPEILPGFCMPLGKSRRPAPGTIPPPAALQGCLWV